MYIYTNCTIRDTSRLIFGLVLLYGMFPAVQAACPISMAGTLETVAWVIDGDTLALANATRVRLAGLDATELGHGRGPDAPGSVEAKNLLKQIVAASDGQVRWEPAQEAQDRYGRLLAHLYTKSGHNIQEQILRAGLALGYARPPNLEHLQCYREAEDQAREQNLGLWRIAPKSADTLAEGASGFTRVQGIVRRVDHSRKSVWIKLGERLSIRIAQEDMVYFKEFAFAHLPQHALEVRGYLYTYHNQIQMRMRHPADMRILN